MKTIGKKMIASALAGTFLFAGGLYTAPVMAAKTPPAQSDRRPHGLSQEDKDAIVNDCVKRYGVQAGDVRAALDARRNLDDIYYAALLSKASGKSLGEIISMKADWWEVERKLGISDAQIDAVVDEMVAEDLAERSGVALATVKNLLKAHYHPRDIRIAGRIAGASGKDVQTVLDMKKINMRWRDVAAQLNVSMDVLRPVTQEEEKENAELDAAEDAALEATK